jgi:hypothetical protein
VTIVELKCVLGLFLEVELGFLRMLLEGGVNESEESSFVSIRPLGSGNCNGSIRFVVVDGKIVVLLEVGERLKLRLGLGAGVKSLSIHVVGVTLILIAHSLR